MSQDEEVVNQLPSIPIIPISAKEGTNLELLLEALREQVQQYDLEKDKLTNLNTEMD